MKGQLNPEITTTQLARDIFTMLMKWEGRPDITPHQHSYFDSGVDTEEIFIRHGIKVSRKGNNVKIFDYSQGVATEITNRYIINLIRKSFQNELQSDNRRTESRTA